MDKKTTRQKKLLQIIEEQGLLPIKALSSILQVSEMTVRRDLQVLQNQQPGAASAAAANAGGYSLFQALERANQQKSSIGRFAASLINANDVVIIDTGSTTAGMLPHLPSNKNLTVLCYNANVMLELRHRAGIQLLFCGGVYHPDTEMFESPEGIRFIGRTRANKVFLSAAGVHAKLGLTCINSYEVATKNAIISSAAERILLVDSSKFNQLRSSYFCALDDINTIITDRNLPTDWQALIEERGITLHLV